jgi:CRP-like cAMP-binding protein
VFEDNFEILAEVLRGVAGALERMAGRPRGFDAQAETDVIGLRIEAGTLLDLLEDHTDMALDLLHSMARAVLALRERIAPPPSAGDASV